ncbi:MAG: DUF4832 domain-containing protein [Thermoguttaceae bacterium]|nr:DUF4832 domain-containing protein [Thermoguttaceae bacterium]MDW8080140.1 DUF4832 domain-containing protein [Thermoguttaceae bacterium]
MVLAICQRGGGVSGTGWARSACILALVALLINAVPEAFGQQIVRVSPREIDDLLPNPHMGWQTFHRTRLQDKNLPSWIPSTVHYARWGWGQLEPRPGELAVDFLDRILEETRQAEQTLAFRVMCCSSTPGEPYHPAWLKEVRGKVRTTRYEGSAPLEVPDLDDPVVLKYHLDFISRLGQRYDGHPVIDHIDLGSVGWWGEWHMSGSSDVPMPSMETRRQIVDAYLKAFRKTPVLMLIGGEEMLRHAVSRGAGWRADCLGDMGGFSARWNHMRSYYTQALAKFGAVNAWEKAPVAWETCWDMRKWVAEGWPLRYIFNYALALHGSYINNKSAPLPQGPEVESELRRFLRRLGYRFVLRELQHRSTAFPGGELTVTSVWQNVGSAPCYRPYRLAYKLEGPGGTLVALSQADIRTWMPGSVDIRNPRFLENPPELPPGNPVRVVDKIKLPGDLPPGEYTLAVGIVRPEDQTPVIRLAIEGRTDTGWYPLSKLRILAVSEK